MTKEQQELIDESVKLLDDCGEFIKKANALDDVDKDEIDRAKNIIQTGVTAAVHAVRAIPDKAE